MIIGIAGPYSADTEKQRQKNLDALNQAGVTLLRKGHIPLIGVNAALPVVKDLHHEERYDAIMAISLAVIDQCEAILVIKESPGANRESDLVKAKGLPVYYSISEIPDAVRS